MRSVVSSVAILAIWGWFAACDLEDLDPRGDCDTGEISCGESCVNPLTSADHCGACNRACGDGETCSAGSCVEGCRGSQSLCDGECVDTSSDSKHCGACGQQCSEGELCSAGECAAGCAEALTVCAGECVDLDSDPAHCGQCGNSCGAEQQCIDGNCECDESTACGSACVDLQSDHGACGSCEIACDFGEECVEGICECAPHLTRCGDACVDLLSDADHCGDCSQSCEDLENSDAPPACMDGACVLACVGGFDNCDGEVMNGCETHLQSSIDHCGMCNNDCVALLDVPNVADVDCVDGACSPICESGWRTCSHELCAIHSDEDPLNCGECFNDCGGKDAVDEATCDGGLCKVVTCEAGFGDCDGDGSNGCEEELHWNDENCGTCGNSCDGLESCVMGVCVPNEWVSVGTSHSCAVRGGEVYCWGHGGNGRLGDGSTETRTLPVKVVGGLKDIVQVSAGNTHSCALDKWGKAWCWGSNQLGKLGDGTLDESHVPVEVDLPPLAYIGASGSNSCALTRDHEVICWGGNNSGQLGDGSTTNRSEFAAVPNLPPVGMLTVGSAHNCALTLDGQVYCWGGNSSAQSAGENTGLLASNPNATLVPMPLDPVRYVRAAGQNTCMITTSNELWCFGGNYYGQLGIGKESDIERDPLRFMDAQDINNVTVGSSALICASRDNGEVYCAGNNGNYRLALDEPSKRRHVATKANIGGALVIMNTYQIHSCGGTKSGDVYCWGINNHGNLGIGNNDEGPNAVQPKW